MLSTRGKCNDEPNRLGRCRETFFPRFWFCCSAKLIDTLSKSQMLFFYLVTIVLIHRRSEKLFFFSSSTFTDIQRVWEHKFGLLLAILSQMKLHEDYSNVMSRGHLPIMCSLISSHRFFTERCDEGSFPIVTLAKGLHMQPLKFSSDVGIATNVHTSGTINELWMKLPSRLLLRPEVTKIRNRKCFHLQFTTYDGMHFVLT